MGLKSVTKSGKALRKALRKVLRKALRFFCSLGVDIKIIEINFYISYDMGFYFIFVKKYLDLISVLLISDGTPPSH